MLETSSASAELHWQTTGQGEDLVLLHGWGMNGAVWNQTVDALSAYFRVHVVDLPGYGFSSQLHADSLDTIASMLEKQAPKQAIWLGWSLGGLVATHMAIHYPNRVTKLITVASSPKFSAERPWRGIQPKVLTSFTEQLMEDFQLTVERFMALQAMGSPTARQDVKALKQAVLSRPTPNPESLLAGLAMLSDVDLRDDLEKIDVPFLRLYGRLDGLVPAKVANDVEQYHSSSDCFIFQQSSHAPFITESDAFCTYIYQFAQSE